MYEVMFLLLINHLKLKVMDKWNWVRELSQKIKQYKIHATREVIEPKHWFDTRQEAYSAAFDYILTNNLIWKTYI